jgi:hypothetical protein
VYTKESMRVMGSQRLQLEILTPPGQVNTTQMKLIKFCSFLAIVMGSIITSCSNEEPKPALTPPVETVEIASGTAANGRLQLPVRLGAALNFAILSKSGITDVYPSAVKGDVGSSPITGAAILLRCNEVTGRVYSVDAAGPLPCRAMFPSMLTIAVGDMQTAYTQIAGRTTPDFLNMGAGNLGGKTLKPGLYKFTTGVILPTNLTISGNSTAIWIFQIDGTLTMSSEVRITLIGGAQAKNIFWQTTGAVTLGTTSHFEGNILSKTAINLQTGATINGRLLAQTAVTLQQNTVNRPN